MGFENAMENLKKAEQAAVFELGKRMGFGALMYAASRLWQGTGQPGAFAVGPCVEACVPCPHPDVEEGEPAHKCDWCCGCGWVTKKVLEAIKSAQKPKKADRKKSTS